MSSSKPAKQTLFPRLAMSAEIRCRDTSPAGARDKDHDDRFSAAGRSTIETPRGRLARFAGYFREELDSETADGQQTFSSANRGFRLSRQHKMSFYRHFKETGATGLEPATSGVTGRRSNQLNYAPAVEAV